MTVRFCSRYPFGQRTHKNTHALEKRSVLAFVRWPTALNSSVQLENRDSLKQNKTGKCFPISIIHIDIERALLA